jgi:hypothetical protein
MYSHEKHEKSSKNTTKVEEDDASKNLLSKAKKE